MAQREGSVYLYLFIATFVLFVGAVVFYFVENSKTNELRTNETKLKSTIDENKKVSDRYVQELQKLKTVIVGELMANVSTDQVEETARNKMKESETFLNQVYKKETDKPAKFFNDMVSIYDDYKDLLKKIIEVENLAKERQNRAQEDEKTAKTQAAEEVKKHAESLATLKTQMDEQQRTYEGKITQNGKEIDRLTKELATVRDEAATKEIQAKREQAVDKNLIASLRARLEQLTSEQRKTKGIEDVEPDGAILDVAGASQIGWIDIGRKQHLRPGIDFVVYQVIKGGKRQLKGRVEVQQVDEATSRVRILETKDDLNPIAKGDFISSPFFDPNLVPIFVIAGKGLETKKITEEALRAKIKSYGAEIKDQVNIDTTFLIALKDADTSDDAKAVVKSAKEFGIPIIRERDILEYMGL